MAALNPLTRELVFKIVFYGPGLGGKTTTLQHIHATSKPEHRGNLVSLATDTDRTLYFDFLPLQVLKLRNLTVRLQLFTVPGQVYYAATRKLVLTGADGVVFVADSQRARFDSNYESFEDLQANLAEHGRKLSEVPHTFHWNKRDLPDVVPEGDLDRRLNLFGAPAISTVATTGVAVFDGLEQITRLVFHAYKAELKDDRPAQAPIFLDAEEVGLTDAIKELADSQPAGPRSSNAAHTVHAPAQSPTLAPQSGAHSPQSELWPEAEREGVKRTETLMGARDAASAVLACDVLFHRILEQGAALAGTADPAVVAALLGVPGERYLAFRSRTVAAREKKDVAVREALECFALVVDARLALTRASR